MITIRKKEKEEEEKEEFLLFCSVSTLCWCTTVLLRTTSRN